MTASRWLSCWANALATSSASLSSFTSGPPRVRSAQTWWMCVAVASSWPAPRSAPTQTELPTSAPNAVHATAGATIVGARPFLVAYNVYLGGAENLQVAKDVAKAVRGSSGGLRNVKGLGLEVDSQAQVSMNLVDTEQTPLYRAYDMVKMEAEARGVSPTRSELVGLVPERVLFETAARHIQLPDFSADMVLEHQVREASDGQTLEDFAASVAGKLTRAGRWQRCSLGRAVGGGAGPDGGRFDGGT